ncbi:LacI family transcriptional regulator [Megasphaera cerevisiae DSM 20462]|jgi:LacI family transcriptional regulator|uniref:LacI family transcriptional regulator n=1 Tax=Megasphaera cerevisiae DSM 20462 TaxID=1122219 RepID=A0A0J6WVS1_9FIRM|nr:LacI family DNA-binding transcriptional regulator [Megasphaera cerevisiae]KMO86669.1 LacI family transcriptional regulator [Megasphaera cerevisiae DSM 20462]MCI1750477.1 LacI family DNA-binding transcriptional regulator [Megasphaera cerevisiae]OKY52738.1 LacI family transcriptional regulator [Megasphaera cerevisiae]SJZ87622.1 transcriptional regulator, LacI family [Megasphaera cerevisiae DSM 20462]
MVTIKQIADLCGVSRGTVDRVLNNRGNVKPEKRELILQMAKKLNYTPNPAGKALAAQKSNPVVGILLPSKGIHFFDDVIDSLEKSEKKYEPYGMRVIWQTVRGYDVEEQCRILNELKPKINALIVNPINDPRFVSKLNELIAAGIFVVTINNDVEQADTHYYVGSNYINGGRTMGALLKMIGPDEAHIGVILGSLKLLGHRHRLQGLQESINNIPAYSIIEVIEDNDDNICSYDKTKNMLTAHPEINVLTILSSGGSYGTCRAAISMTDRNFLILVFDTIPTTREMMKSGIIRAAIYQHPHQQGQKAMQLVFDYLVNGIIPERNHYIMNNEIRILENI